MPTPTMLHVMKETGAGCRNVHANSGPKNGPTHGVASSVDAAPLVKTPNAPSCRADPSEPMNPGNGISKTPSNDNDNVNTPHAMIIVNQRDWNCWPQFMPTVIAKAA